MPSNEHSRLTIHEAGDALLRLVGEVDVATAPELARYLDNDPRVRVIDMAQVTFIDSSGLKVLVVANRSHDASDMITLQPVLARRAPGTGARRDDRMARRRSRTIARVAGRQRRPPPGHSSRVLGRFR